MELTRSVRQVAGFVRAVGPRSVATEAAVIKVTQLPWRSHPAAQRKSREGWLDRLDASCPPLRCANSCLHPRGSESTRPIYGLRAAEQEIS